MAKEMIEEIFEEDEREYGCGYYSVCLEHACPCHPDAPVSQGFSKEIWEKMRKEMEDELEVDEEDDWDDWDDEEEIDWGQLDWGGDDE